MDFGVEPLGNDYWDVFAQDAIAGPDAVFDNDNLEAYLGELSDPDVLKFDSVPDIKAEPEVNQGYPGAINIHAESTSSIEQKAADAEQEMDTSVTTMLASPRTTSSRSSTLPVVTTGELPAGKKTTAKEVAEVKKSKRARRIRTPKQQELNRLAQQRYRERKKQKYTSLQQAVDELSIQLDKVAVIEGEKAELMDQNAELEELLTKQTIKVQARDTIIKQQQKQIDAQQAEILSLRQKVAALSAGEQSADNQLLQQLASAVQTAFDENECKSAQIALGQFPEVLMDSIRKTVQQCCREINSNCDVAPHQSPAHIVQVSCC